MRSHRSRGAWIEILIIKPKSFRPGRIAHAVRGLKLLAAYAIDPVIVSHRSRGAWIEMIHDIVVSFFDLSHRSRGAWIEIIEMIGG